VIGLNSKFDNYTIFLGCPSVTDTNEPSEAYAHLLGDGEFSSQNEYAKEAGLEIISIIYSEK